MILTQCLKCGDECYASIDEVRWFVEIINKEGTICEKCESRTSRHLRHKAIMGFYETKAVEEKIIEKLANLLFGGEKNVK